ncbi:hypothetical protein GA0074696_1026 [Micromonospora purpureochromogenes]|uniref:Uncharacterized protein n=1 Tax=Micromonospora purpureochromogenes TaxID=47872 RepID=A0A1C4VBX4_9ACTN|nr:hypothetical protein [Micromonospora purpureochromogenes]SCE81530.1 hypothetical protein GA0074696_1026 [Micromonospora purpureochromogenes]
MKSGMRVGLAVGLGYVLGRRKKLRTALTLAAAVAAGRASRDPHLLKRGTDLLTSSPHLAGLGKLGSPLASAGKAAAGAAAGSGLDAISGKLRGSADALRRRSGGGGGDSGGGGGDEQRSAPDEEQELGDQPQPGEGGADPATSKRGR